MKRLNKTALRLTIASAVLLAAGCTDTTKAKLASYGDEQTVCLLNDSGETIRKWVSSGKVDSHNGGLHVFNDKKTDNYVKVSGRAIISTHDYCQDMSS